MQRSTLIVVLALAFLFCGSATWAAQRIVLAEEFTGTWCTYCPGAQMGLEDLENATHDSVAVASFHTGDVFSTGETEARLSFYGITGVPTVVFQGRDYVVGGSHTQSQYYRYRPVFDSWAHMPTSVVMVMDGAYNPATRAGTATLHLMNAGASSISGKLILCLTESEIAYNWQGQNHLTSVVRDMIPDGVGETVTIPGRGILDKTYNYSVGASWNETHCEIVAFLQDQTSREVYQAAKWEVRPNVSITVTPDQSPVVIPPGGGPVGYTIDLVNNTSSSQTFDLWSNAYLPNGATRATLARTTVTLPANGTQSTHYTANVPANAPAGNYTYVGYVGTYPATTMDRGYFPGTKSRTDDANLGLQICPVK